MSCDSWLIFYIMVFGEEIGRGESVLGENRPKEEKEGEGDEESQKEKEKKRRKEEKQRDEEKGAG